MTMIPEPLRRFVQERARQRCEYCLMPEFAVVTRHEPDHIIAEKHGGLTQPENLAWSCFFCNRHKGSDIASIDPMTLRIVSLFNPRQQQWRRHFRLDGPRIEPLTASGRTTSVLLRFNSAERIDERKRLMASGSYPG
jgi:hypothetical protein